MPPRYPAGSILGGLFMATIFPIMSKVPVKSGDHTAQVIDVGAQDNTIGAAVVYNTTTNIPHIASPATGWLPLFLFFFIWILSILGEELITTAVMHALNVFVIPFLWRCYAFLISKFFANKARPDPTGGPKLRPVDHELQYLRAIVAHDATQVSDLKERFIKNESERRDAVSRRAAQETGQLAQKDQQILELCQQNNVLGARLRDAAAEVEPPRVKPSRLRERTRRAVEKSDEVHELESALTTAQQGRQDAVDAEGRLRDQFESELTAAQQARQDAVDAAGHLRSQLEEETAKTVSLQNIIDNDLQARQQPEESEAVPATATNDLQLAEDRIATLEREALLRDQQVRAADERLVERAVQQESQEAEERLTAAVAKTEQEVRDSIQVERQRESREAEERLTAAVTRKEQEVRDSIQEEWQRESREAEERLTTAVAKAEQDVRDTVQEERQRESQEAEERLTAAVTRKEQEVRDSIQEQWQRESREAEERLKAAVTKAEQDVRGSIEEKWQQESQEAEERLTVAVTRKEQEVRDSLAQGFNARELEWRNNFEAECNERVNSMAVDSQNSLRAQLQEAVQRAISAEGRLANPEGDLEEARDLARDLYNSGAEQWTRAEAAERRAEDAEAKVETESTRADTAEEEVRRFKEGKKSQDLRIAGLHSQITTLKHSRPEAAEVLAVGNDLIRAQALIAEFCNRSYDFATRQVVVHLCRANEKIEAIKQLVKKPTRPSNQQVLKLISAAEVGNEDFLSLENPRYRQVVVRQCAAVNAKLMVLRQIINQDKVPNKARLLAEILAPRGDEAAVFDMEPRTPSPPESDEDEDENALRPASDSPPFRWKPLPTGPRPRPANEAEGRTALPTSRRPRPTNEVEGQHPLMSLDRNVLPTSRRPGPTNEAEGQNTPMSMDRNVGNPRKRKGSSAEMEPKDSGKRHDSSSMGMRPIGPSPFAQQGSSSSDANHDQSEAKPASQNDVQTHSPFPERDGEAGTPQRRSSDQTDLSPRLSGLPSFPTQLSSPSNAAIASQDVSHVDDALHPKPTKIPGPTVPAQEAAAPSSSEAPTGFFFSAPKDIASAVVKPTPAQQYHSPIFTGLSRLGAVIAEKEAAQPGLPSVDDEVLEFESSAVTEVQDSDSEPDDEFPGHIASGHIASDIEEDDEDETVWENALYPEERDGHFDIDLDDEYDPPGYQPSTIRALDMTDQNYEEQAAEAASRNMHQDPSKKESQPKGEVLEDNFHIDLD